MNACQAVVKPDCSKPKVQKASGIQKALANILTNCFASIESANTNESARSTSLQEYMALGIKVMPPHVATSVKICTVEFAGIKFKTRVISGTEYLKYIEDVLLRKTLREMPNIKLVAVCEEMYSFTPDDFKAATRDQRQTKKQFSISHLKTSQEILSASVFDKSSIVTTREGKCLISTYLAKHATKLGIKKDVTIDILSEAQIEGCTCPDTTTNCTCSDKYTHPLRCTFTSTDGLVDTRPVQDIKQRKGEAEMSQVDLLIDYKDLLTEGDACISVVSSGDIDAITIHMFVLSHLWPRKEDRNFKYPVYVLLQKPGGLSDLYNITKILELLEATWKEEHIGMKVAIALCLGGNDYLPKIQHMSHDTIMEKFMKIPELRLNLLQFTTNVDGKCTGFTVSPTMYEDLFKRLYTPRNLDPDKLTYDEVRQLSIRKPNEDKLRDSQRWLQPASAGSQLCKLVRIFIMYMLTAGNSSANLPDFLGRRLPC